MSPNTAVIPLESLETLAPDIQTKLRIMHAVDGPLNRVSIQHICSNAGISRPTFYSHFSSKEDLYYWFADLCQTFYLNKIGHKYRFYDGYLAHARLLKSESAFLKNTSQGGDNPATKLHTIERRRQTLRETLTNHCKVDLTDELSFAIDFFTYSEAEMARRWFVEGLPGSAEEFARKMTLSVPSILREALDANVPE